MKRTLLLLPAIIILTFNTLRANNVIITNISAPSTTTVQFDITWENSWYAAAPSNNWDAVWIFVKTQVCALGSSPWIHGNVSTVSGDHSVTGGVLQVDAVADGKGIFLRRSALGSGNIASATVTLQLSNTYVILSTNYEVIGIEMANVPSGSFTVGDGSLVSTQSTNAWGTNNTTTAYSITSEAGIAYDGLRNDAASSPLYASAHNAIIAGFPKGFNAFYCMKYEISQQQYATFLNLLDFNQQINRTAVTPASVMGTAALAAVSGNNRNSIEIRTAGVPFSTPAIYGNDLNGNNTYDEAADGGNIACNYLSWDDLQAYLDWAALRPMTELEYEKAVRGVNAPLLNEYPWGSTTINQAVSSALTNGGQTSEVSTSTADGLCTSNGGASAVLGPLRVGFAATAASLRTGAGASYYGIMDLGGNVWEQAFQCGYYTGAAGRTSTPTFTGVLGDGALDAGGNANATNWGGGVSMSIVRGGNWEYANQQVQTSDRFYATVTTENATRVRRTGGRGVR